MNVVWGLLVLAVSVAVAVAAMLLVRRSAPEGSYFSDGDRASGVFGVLATGFAIFAGFVIFLAFTSYDQSRAGGEPRRSLLVQQFETAQFLPSRRSRTARGRARLLRAVRRVRGVAADGGRDRGDAINPWGIALFRSLQTVSLETPERGGGVRKVARPDVRTRGSAPEIACTALLASSRPRSGSSSSSSRASSSPTCCSSPTAPSERCRRRC